MFDVGDDASAAILGKFDGSFYLREHGAGFEIAVFFKMISFFYGEVSEFFLIW